MSASKNAAKCLKGQKSQRIGAKNGDLAEDFTQKSLHQTIRPNTTAAGELFRPSLSRPRKGAKSWQADGLRQRADEKGRAFS